MLVLCGQIYYTSIQSTLELVFIENPFEFQVEKFKATGARIVAKMLLLLLFLFVVVYLVLWFSCVFTFYNIKTKRMFWIEKL